MQIVIDIPEDDYQRICETKLSSYGAITYIIHRAFKYIKNGKPLPKGHGDLVDRDAVYHAYDYSDMEYTMIKALQDAATIIEADGGDAE